MKKILALSFAAAFAFPMVAGAAGGNHPMAGCGLGYVLFGHDDNSKIKQILAATTNATSGNQTFGMSSGTSGCTEDGAVKFVKEAEVFAEVNLDSLRREMAMGQGEYVRSFATLLGASRSQIPALINLFQKEYETLFPNATTSSGDLMVSLSSLLASHQGLIS